MRNAGNMWSGWVAYLSFFRHVAKLPLDVYEKFAHYEAATELAGPRYMHAKFWIASDFPETVGRDEQNRPHCATGPQLRWRDGWELFFWHGVRVPAQLIEAPETITVAQIDAEPNAEIRRVMIERMGLGRYANESGARVVHEDKDSLGLPRRLLWRDVPDHDPIVVCEVINSTPEPGAYEGGWVNPTTGRVHKIYHLTVHHEARPLLDADALGDAQKLTCHNAIASTFGLRGEDYQPAVET